MERLKARQRLEKLNMPLLTQMTTSSPSEKISIEPTKRLEQDDPVALRTSDLAGKSRVQSIILNSTPDRPVRPRKPNSHVTSQMIADFQFEESKPIELYGKIYRMHPASIPEPELEPIPSKPGVHKDTQIATRLAELNDVTAELAALRRTRIAVDKEYEKIVRHVTELAMKYPDKKIKLEEEFVPIRDKYDADTDAINRREEQLIDGLDTLKLEIQQARTLRSIEQSSVDEREREILEAKKRNSLKIKAYEDNLKQLNRDFNLQQQPYESEEDFLQRIREATAAIEDPYYVESRMALHDALKFKNGLKEFIRDPSTIEYAFNFISDEKGAGGINELNNIMPLIKSRYERTYGMNQIKDVELVKFLTDVLQAPLEVAKKEEQEEAESPIAQKIKALESNKKSILKPDLLRQIILIAQYVSGPIVVRYDGGLYEVVRGQRKPTALSIVHQDKKKPIESAGLALLRLVFIDLMEKLRVQHPKQYQIQNEEINRRTKEMYGEGYGIGEEKLPKMCKFGQVELDLHKLFYKNVLSISNKGFKIHGFKNTPVSDEFVSVIMHICKGSFPTARELNKIPERQLYDQLLHVARIHKKVEHTADRTIEELQKRLTLVEGEIEAGNSNRDLLVELKDILYKLNHLGVISQSNMKTHFDDIKKTFF